MFRNFSAKLFSVLLAALIALFALSACSAGSAPAPSDGSGAASESVSTDGAEPAEADDSPFEISIMTRMGTAEAPLPNNPVITEIERISNTKLNIEWVPAAAYSEKINATIASNDYPMVMMLENGNKRGTVEVDAVRAGVFWKVGDYMPNFDNLKDLDPGTINNASIDGELWGMFRTRPIVRNGGYYRSDWAEKLGFGDPKNLDELTAMLRAFVNDDPDGNGIADTGGLAQEQSFDTLVPMLAQWYGIGQEWEIVDGIVRPAFENPEYINMLKYIKMLYDEGLMNRDFATTEATKRDEMMAGDYGVALVSIDKGDLSLVPLQQRYPDANFNVIVNFADSPHPVHGRSGFDGLYYSAKKAVPEEADFLRIMNWYNVMYSTEVNNLVYRGFEGEHYTKTGEDAVSISDEQNAKYILEVNPMEQLAMRFTKNIYKVDNLPYYNAQVEAFFAGKYTGQVDANPAFSWDSETFNEKGKDLETIYKDARIKFVTGVIDEAGWNSEIERYRASGGTEMIAEYQAAYEALK
ncbi:MAG: extracellular solute-binding protein [Clostridiales bacterium]|jgi:putative aldouronate transport system substrate-binding protein|nr:extracellular solute-binding protein [Clostridiales bacterium]